MKKKVHLPPCKHTKEYAIIYPSSREKAKNKDNKKERTKEMSKAYIVTAVDYGDSVDGKARTIGVFFDRDEAQKALNADMDTYKGHFESLGQKVTEDDLAVWHGEHHGCEWNVEEKDIRIPLTPLQFTNLNGIAESIETNANDSYFSYADSLSKEEDEYLLKSLANRGIAIDKEKEVEMRGEEARAWIAKHVKENG